MRYRAFKRVSFCAVLVNFAKILRPQARNRMLIEGLELDHLKISTNKSHNHEMPDKILRLPHLTAHLALARRVINYPINTIKLPMQCQIITENNFEKKYSR
jgi:hypothetical protein